MEKWSNIGQRLPIDSRKNPRLQMALGSIRRRLRELTEEKEAAKREVAELRQVVAEQTEYLDTLAAKVELILNREDDLRAMLLGAHEQLMNRTDEIQATLTAELQQAVAQRDVLGQDSPDVRAPARTVDQSFVPSEHSDYQQIAKHIDYRRLIRRIREVVRSTLPAEATVIVVSKGDDELLKLSGRRAWHFPQNESGVYAGHYPADSIQAIAHLEELRAKGGEFLLLPGTAFWWLKYYRKFVRHLDSHYRRVWDDEACVIFELSGPRADAEGAR